MKITMSSPLLNLFFLVSLLLLLPPSSLVASTDHNHSENALSSTQHQQCIHEHFSALLHLKLGFVFEDGYTITNLSSWNPDNMDCCSWEGITCDPSTGHVIGLHLCDLGLEGQIDFESLFLLRSSLQRLDLSCNNFDPSPIPSGLDQLTSLTHLNLSHSNFYGQIPLGISRLTSLVSLDLSSNSYFDQLLKLENPSLGALVRNMSSLRELRLDVVEVPAAAQGSEWGQALSSALPNLRKLSMVDCGLSGPIHPSLSQLHFLSEVHLSFNNLSSVLPESIFRMPSLQSLDVSYNSLLVGKFPSNMSCSLRKLFLADTAFCRELFPWDSISSSFKHFTHLALAHCNLPGALPPTQLFNSNNLVYLDLSSNNFTGHVPSSYGRELRNLEVLILYNNSLSGTIPSSLLSLPSLQQLHLSSNRFSGQLGEFQNASSSRIVTILLDNNNLQGPLPRSIFKLTKLEYLELSSNNFTGPIPSSKGNELQNLEVLALRNNSLSGTIPSSLFSLPSLRGLYLSSNRFSGQLSEFHNASSSRLKGFELRNNTLQGPIPQAIFNLKDLQLLDLSLNNFSGSVDLSLFLNLLDIYFLDLSYNSLSIDEGRSSITFTSLPQIKLLALRSCNIVKFPDILRNQKRMGLLDLSDNKITGEIPKWIWGVGNNTLYYLNLSHNALEGLQQPFPHFSLTLLVALDLSFNKLKGITPIPTASTFYFTLSNNEFRGEVPSEICNATSLEILDLSDNQFSGLIPKCLEEISDALDVLNLQGNMFRGPLLQTFKEGCTLRSLGLHQNQLEGHLPSSLANCTRLEVLNVGNNQMVDTFPFWLGNLPRLRVLVLRSNQFHGIIEIPLPENNFSLLQIFDISFNNFTGDLRPDMFRSWKGMMGEDKSQSLYLGNQTKDGKIYYQYTVTVIGKGIQMRLIKILTTFTLLDLSNNKFQGGIPKSIGNLTLLRLINMSHNCFSGEIPASLGNLKDLESLDLSQNELSGEIPWQLTKLSSLSVLNLSQNFLERKIPQGPQFNTFSNESFQGNLGLCGFPLSKKCKDESGSLTMAETESKYDWEFMWIGFEIGHGVGIGIVFWTLALWRNGRRSFYMLVDRMILLMFTSSAFSIVPQCRSDRRKKRARTRRN